MSFPVRTEWITVPAAGGRSIDAYLAVPPAGSGPGLVIVQEIFGVNAHIRAVAEQYALNGFVVLAHDLFWRQERRVELGYDAAGLKRGFELAAGLQQDEVLADLSLVSAALRGRAEVGGRKCGALGFCLGGRLAYQAAAMGVIDAAVCYYGGGIHEHLDKAGAIRCPLLFHYAERDDHIPLTAVEAVRAAMVGKDAEIHLYAGARHGFNCWERGSYHPPSAALAQGRSVGFLARHLF
jgi:carboxymethylenebutenolidase